MIIGPARTGQRKGGKEEEEERKKREREREREKRKENSERVEGLEGNRG